MKTIRHILMLTFILITGIATSQVKDTLINVNGKQVHFDYNLKWSKQIFNEKLIEFKADQAMASFRASQAVSSLLGELPIAQDPCQNGDFEDDYATWTGLSLTHSVQVLPIENGLNLNPGILALPYTGTSSGQNYTSIETTGLDPIISVASPSFPLQRTAPGTTGTKSLRLGNNAPGKGAEGVAKRFVVTAETAEYYFQYAVVMDRSHSNPDGSVNGSEAFFIAEATDMSGASIDKVVEVGNPNNPFINAVNNGSTYYRNWRCAYLDLSSHIGQEVVIMFVNSDCSAGAHKGYTYIDDTCDDCENQEGDVNINIEQVDCLTFPQEITGDFLLPGLGETNVNITLEIYQSNVLVNTITSPSITAPNYSFTLSASDFPDQTPGTCYDIVGVLTFDMVNLLGNLVTVTQTSSKEVLGVQDGEVPGLNNDVCFCEPEPSNEGAYCCDDENLVANGNFEAGNTGFSSSYTQTATTFPGEYDVTNSAAAFGATVTDHSFCADPVMYASNNQFMVVNGSTQQASTAVIWEQTITGLEKGAQYMVCANFKNMPQCTFDILPQVFLNAGATSSGAQTINTNPSDPCDWQTVDITFTATGSSHNIQILLDEGGNGDGNDLAIDDIYVGRLGDPNLQITVQHDGTTNQITGSLNTISPTDDTLHGNDCVYHWFVAESAGFPASIIWSTFAHGNTSGSVLPGAIPGPNWNLTTTFPGYVFNNDTLYIVGMYAPECGCYDSDLTYQLTFNTHSVSEPLSQETQDAIIDAILNGVDIDEVLDTKKMGKIGTKKLSLFPNPVQENFTVKLLNDTFNELEVLDANGRRVLAQQFNGSNATEFIDVSSLPSGMYFLKVKGSSNELHHTKFIKR